MQIYIHLNPFATFPKEKVLLTSTVFTFIYSTHPFHPVHPNPQKTQGKVRMTFASLRFWFTYMFQV